MDLESIMKLSKDLKEASKTLGRDEARFLVDAYYMIQEDRKRSFNQERSLEKDKEPHAILTWFANQSQLLEKQIAMALDYYSSTQPEAQWARAQVGIGPIISAGLLAHIDLEFTTTATKLWRFAGLDPTSKWEKGQKRPWNASLKTLCWKAGESFVKTCNNEQSFYGPVYTKYKAKVIQRNEAGEFAERSASILAAKKIKKETEAYKAYSVGKLPPAHVHAMARRYAVKLFLSHYLEVAQRAHGIEPATPYIIAIGGHHDYIPPPPGVVITP
jgi:hypothetical protein